MKNSILTIVEDIARNNEERIAVKSTKGQLTYGQLWQKSDNLAAWLKAEVKDNKPVMVYGHKSPQMLVCFLACVKAGKAYCPVDISMPQNRIREIACAIDNHIILATEKLEMEDFKIVDSSSVEDICREAAGKAAGESWVKGKDTFYIIFTSGSTGNPKGVEISLDNLSSFAAWSRKLVGEHLEQGGGNDAITFLNQAPFSFDLSVMDLYTSLSLGGTLICLDKGLQADTAEMFSYMRENDINVWVSTPSFAEMCLADRGFCKEMLKNLKMFLFCGERLTKETAKKLMERFPESKVINTYGPTESTVAVTSVEITKEIIENNEILPIGIPKEGTMIMIKDEEMIIVGDTVGKGYYRNPEKTKSVFFKVRGSDDKEYMAYKTGDKGYFKDGNYYCTGRMDHQIKLHGYRIELGDIESNLMLCKEVEQVAVLPKYDGEKIRSLVAFVKAPPLEGGFKDVKYLKNRLKEKLPTYMIPKNIKFLDDMPMTANGKLDRKKLEAELL